MTHVDRPCADLARTEQRVESNTNRIDMLERSVNGDNGTVVGLRQRVHDMETLVEGFQSARDAAKASGAKVMTLAIAAFITVLGNIVVALIQCFSN